ncbi:MAG: sigma-54 dependent transcriptional regulator [Planctomycetota bacterium]
MLVIDDDQGFCATLADYRRNERGLRVVVAHSAASGLEQAVSVNPAVILLDQRLPDSEGTEVCRRLLERSEEAKVVLMTAYPTFRHAVGALQAGACDYLTKPFDPYELDFALDRALRIQKLERLEKLQDYLRARQQGASELVGTLPETRRLILRAAGSGSTVLIAGATGTGKSLVARCIHQASDRSEGPFIAVNCSALPESLIESELFGHVKGAFSGAIANRRGALEMAEGGTLLLDEIGDLPLALQAKLLHVLEERTVRRSGGDTFHPVDVRIVAATHRDLEREVTRGRFRKDLYFRLGVLAITLPDLRERREDIPALCGHILARLSPKRSLKIPPADMQQLTAYDWPGNVRELHNVLERALILATPDGELNPASHLPKGAHARASAPAPAPRTPAGQDSRQEVAQSWAAEHMQGSERIPTLAQIEQAWIDEVLTRLDGNLTQTARALGISRSTLKRKLRQSTTTTLKTLAAQREARRDAQS